MIYPESLFHCNRGQFQMKLKDRLGREGAFLFRWRSYLPLLLLVVAFPTLFEAARIQQSVGEQISHGWVYFCMAVSFSGQLVRGMTVGYVPAGTSGRGTKAQSATVLNTGGMYSIVRNPLYLGNFLAMLGLAMSLMVWWFVAIFVLAYWLYIERIIWTEEEFLSARFGSTYDEWCARTPAFIPDLSLWRPADLSFSLRTVLRREYHGVLAIAAAYFVVEAILDLGIEGEGLAEWIVEDSVWVYLFAIGCLIYLALLFLSKRTRLLTVPGRR